MAPHAGCDVVALSWSVNQRQSVLSSCSALVKAEKKLPALFAYATRQPLRKPSGEKMPNPLDGDAPSFHLMASNSFLLV